MTTAVWAKKLNTKERKAHIVYAPLSPKSRSLCGLGARHGWVDAYSWWNLGVLDHGECQKCRRESE
jgi:hypothetical protein